MSMAVSICILLCDVSHRVIRVSSYYTIEVGLSSPLLLLAVQAFLEVLWSIFCVSSNVLLTTSS